MFSVVILGLVAYSEEAHAATLLIDVDFGTPPHTVGAAPVEGFTGPPVLDTIGNLIFTPGDLSPIVVSSFGAMTDQPMVYREGLSNRVEFFLRDNLGANIDVDLPICSKYILEEDILMENPSSGINVFYDSPTVRRVLLNAGDTTGDVFVTLLAANGDILDFQHPIGTWTAGQVTNLRSEIDLVNDEWKVFLNDALAHTSVWGTTELHSHRLNAAVGPSSQFIGLDNVLISCAEDILPPMPPMMAIGGDMIQMETTSILAAGTQYTAAWMIPVIVSGIGIAIVIARKF